MAKPQEGTYAEVTDNSVQLMERITNETAMRLFWMGDAVKGKLQGQLSRPFPPASAPGEYPALRSGRLRSAVTMKPDTVQAIKTHKKVFVYFDESAPYWKWLLQTGRKGPVDVYRSMREELREIWSSGR